MRSIYCFVLAIILSSLVLFPQISDSSNENSTTGEVRTGTRTTAWVPATGWSKDYTFMNNFYGENISDQSDIAAEGSNVHLVFMHWQKDYDFLPHNRDRNILYIKSTDGGRTWPVDDTGSIFVQLNSPVIDREWGTADIPTIAVSGSTVHVAWVQNDIGMVEHSRIRYRRSLDSGDTWSDEMTVETQNDSWNPHIVANGDSVHLFWTEHNQSFTNFFMSCRESTILEALTMERPGNREESWPDLQARMSRDASLEMLLMMAKK